MTFNRLRLKIDGPLRGDALRARTMRGGAWLGTASIAEQGCRFVRNMFLARLLAPGAFGTMAIVFASAAIVDMLTDVGLRAAIIQNPRGSNPAYLNSSWWLGLCRSLFSYSIIFTVAPWISHFYGRPEISGLLRVALLSVLFNGVMSPRSVLTQREMKFERWAAITNGGGICGVILTIMLSFYMRDVWALALGYCSENAFRLLLSYILCPGPPSLHFDWTAARDLLKFSRGMFGLGILNLIIARADVFVLGRLCPMAALGLYTMAVALVTTPSTFITSMLGATLLPPLSSIQEDDERVNSILLEVTSWLLQLGMPAAVFICLCAPSLLRIVYGPLYAPGAGPLSLASATVFLTVINSIPTDVLFAKGLPALHRHAVLASAVTILVGVYPACKVLGPVGGQIAALLAASVGYLFQVISLRSVTGLNLLKYGSAFLRPTIGSALMLAIVLASRHHGLMIKPALDITLCGASCVLAYAICVPLHLREYRKHSSSLRSAQASESAPAI